MIPQPIPYLIPTLAAANFAVGVGSFIAIGILSPMASDLGLTAAEAGFVMTIYAIAYAVGSPLLVAATGSWSRRAVLASGVGLLALATIVSAMAETADVLFASRAIAALGGGLVTPVVAGVAAANSPPEKRGSAMAISFFGLSASQVIGMPVCTWIGYQFGWEAAFWISTLLAALALVGILIFVPRGTAFQANSLATLGSALLDLKGVFAIFLTATTMGSIYIVFTYMGPILEQGMGFDGDGVSLFLMTFGIGGVAGSLLGGRAVDRFGPGRCIIIIIASQILFMLVFSTLPIPVMLLFISGVIGAGFGWAFMVPQQLRLIAMAPERQSVSLALNASAIYLGASFGSAIGAWVVETWGLSALGVAASCGAALALAHFWLSERWLNS